MLNSIFSCNYSAQKEKLVTTNDFDQILNLVNENTVIKPYLLVIPEFGCEGCINQAENFAKRHAYHRELLTIIVQKGENDKQSLAFVLADSQGISKAYLRKIDYFYFELVGLNPVFYSFNGDQIYKTVIAYP